MSYNHKLEEDREDGLAVCKVCGGGEGSLPSKCPNRPLTIEEQDSIYAGELDFDTATMVRKPVWWVAK